MSQLKLSSTPQVQFPLRLHHELFSKFNQISSSTRIPKSTLGRLAISTFLHQIETKGISRVLDELENQDD